MYNGTFLLNNPVTKIKIILMTGIIPNLNQSPNKPISDKSAPILVQANSISFKYEPYDGCPFPNNICQMFP